MNPTSLYEFSSAELRFTNRKQAAAEAKTSPCYVAAMSRAGFTRSRLITAAMIIDWRWQHPDFRRVTAPKSKKKGGIKKKTKK